jgi:hypothetical protein
MSESFFGFLINRKRENYRPVMVNHTKVLSWPRCAGIGELMEHGGRGGGEPQALGHLWGPSQGQTLRLWQVRTMDLCSYQLYFLPETHIKRQATRQDCLPSLRWGLIKWNSEWWGKFFCTGRTRVANAGQKSLVLARLAQRTNQGRTPFHMYQQDSPIAQVPIAQIIHCDYSSIANLCMM